MGNVYPNQTCTVSPYSEYNSNVVNKLTRIASQERNCINSGFPVDVVLDSTSPLTCVEVGRGSVFKDDVFISLDDEFRVDFEDGDFYISGPAFNEAGYYYVLLEYIYVKSFPSPRCSIKIVKPSQHALFTSAHVLLKVVHVMFNGMSFEIDGIYDADPSEPLNERLYSRTQIGLENSLPTFDPTIDQGRFIYTRDSAYIYFGLDTDWISLGTFEYPCDTSGCILNHLAYIGPGDIAYEAIATSRDSLATCIVTRLGTGTSGRVRFNGRVTGVLESGIDATAGDTLYLSSTETGTVTNVKPSAPYKAQPIGHCLSTLSGSFTTILSGLGIVTTDGTIEFYDTVPVWTPGDEGRAIYANDTDTFWFGTSLGWVRYALSTETIYHNGLAGLQGGDSTSFYHLTFSQYSNLGDGSHNGLAGLQGGTATQRYHLTYSQYVGVGSTLPSTLMSLKSYIMSLNAYRVDTKSLWNRDLNGESIGNTPIGDVVSNEYLINNGSYGTNKTRFGLFGLFTSNYWTSKTSLPEEKSYANSLNLTDDIALIAGGNNGTFVGSTELYTNSADTWTTMTPLLAPRYAFGSATFNSDLGFVFGGYNGAPISTSERYSYSGDSWSSRATMTLPVYWCGSASFTADYCLAIAGYEGTTLVAASALYTNSANNWATKGSVITARTAGGSVTLNSDACIYVGGSNGTAILPNNEKFSLSANTWSIKSSFPTNHYHLASICFNSDMGLIGAGYNGSSLSGDPYMFMYSDSKNTWNVKSQEIISLTARSGISFNCNSGLMAGGQNASTVLPNCEKYIDNEILASMNGFNYLSTVSCSATPLHHPSNISIETNRLSNTNSIIVSVIPSLLYNCKKSTNLPTVDVSLDDGFTWITDQDIDNFVDVTSLSPSGSDYQLKMRINLMVDANCNTWTLKNPMNRNRLAHGSLSFTDDLSFVAGGNNGFSSWYHKTELYSDSANVWTIKIDYPDHQSNQVGLSIKDNEGIFAGGSNASNNNLLNSFKYNLADDVFSNRADRLEGNFGHVGCALDFNSGIICGGTNGTLFASTHKILDSQNTWQIKSSMPLAKARHSGAQLTNYTAIFYGGVNSSSALDLTEKFNDTSNIWMSKINGIHQTEGHGAFSLTNDLLLIAGGCNLSDIITSSICSVFCESGNIWTVRSQNDALKVFYSASANQTQNLGLISGGANNITTRDTNNYAVQYCHGETSLIGFSLIYV